MKKVLFTTAFGFGILLFSISCNTGTGDQQADLDSLRADSLWKVRIADSISQARAVTGTAGVSDTSGGDTPGIETIANGMKEGLNQVQEGLDKVKKITEAGSKSAKEISEGVKKTSDAVHKTVDEARKTLNGE
ncbi:hypothetical protein [Niabella drilacis]|uniref:Uncharacterized protein n=1 Tax=Niabella drilacis (strain DSM 25811 / CCM 8410 / CCUG 62505 / LMG 26954 / E90) TaxID=1285928 RepID=A0A1G6U6R7_NIADE|nr:hypothetical protein [Niabella drilacis]SDD36983.1 hypothetical protein SAMN04487894_108165 [Niabella drilacis]